VPPVDARKVALMISSALGSQGKDVKPYGAGDATGLIIQRLCRG